MPADLKQAFEIQPAPVILAGMPSLKDDQQKAAFGEVLTDELKVILEYVKGIPALEEEIIQIYITVNDISNRLNRLERVANDHGPGTERP